MVKLEKEQAWLNGLLNQYKCKVHNQIYFRLKNIAKGKYLRGEGIQEFQEQFFVNFIVNGESINNYDNLYVKELHEKLIRLRRKIDPYFLINNN